jgi:hypothetical protein
VSVYWVFFFTRHVGCVVVILLRFLCRRAHSVEEIELESNDDLDRVLDSLMARQGICVFVCTQMQYIHPPRAASGKLTTKRASKAASRARKSSSSSRLRARSKSLPSDDE